MGIDLEGSVVPLDRPDVPLAVTDRFVTPLTLNDPGDRDEFDGDGRRMPNLLQNYPVLHSALNSNGRLTVVGSLNSFRLM